MDIQKRLGFPPSLFCIVFLLSDYCAGVSAAGAAGVSAAAGAGAAAGAVVGAGAGAVVAAGAGAMPERVTGVLIAKDAQMLITQMKIARLQVAFSMKSVVLR